MKYCLALDLQDDKELILAYKNHHLPNNIWPEIVTSLYESGIVELEIFHVADRLMMIMEVNDNFSFTRKELMDSETPKVQQWESLMLRFQKTIKTESYDEKWLVMEKIFKLTSC